MKPAGSTDLDALRTGIRVSRRQLEHRPFSRFAVAYALTLTPLALTIAAAASFHPALFVLAPIVAGFVQNALGILTHEASHYFVHGDRGRNDRLADALICLPIFNTVEGYRREHLMHHRDCCDATDPYFDLYGPYETRRQVLAGFVRDLTGMTAITAFVRRYRRSGSATPSPSKPLALIAVQGVIALGAYAVTGWWWAYAALWLAPLATIPFAINRIRTFVEHHAAPGQPEAARSTSPTWFEYLTIAPYGYANHFEHHLMPDVPYYQLGWAHHELVDRGFRFGPEHQAPAGYLRSFRRLFAELR